VQEVVELHRYCVLENILSHVSLEVLAIFRFANVITDFQSASTQYRRSNDLRQRRDPAIFGRQRTADKDCYGPTRLLTNGIGNRQDGARKFINGPEGKPVSQSRLMHMEITNS